MNGKHKSNTRSLLPADHCSTFLKYNALSRRASNPTTFKKSKKRENDSSETARQSKYLFAEWRTTFPFHRSSFPEETHLTPNKYKQYDERAHPNHNTKLVLGGSLHRRATAFPEDEIDIRKPNLRSSMLIRAK